MASDEPPPAKVPAQEASEQQPAKRSRRTRWIVGGVIAVLGTAAVALALALARAKDETDKSEEGKGGHADGTADQRVDLPAAAAVDKALRLTKDVRQALLDQNEGFKTSTSFKTDNFRETRQYLIHEGQLHVHAVGKAAMSDRHDDKSVADDSQVHRYLYKNLYALNTDGLG